MDEAIKNFGKQFDFIPEIKNKENLKDFKHIVLLGMGGSHLAADVAKNIDPSLDIIIHKDYGLPNVGEEFLKESLIIASSYSGNTEEVIEGLNIALSKNLNTAVITVGGKLLQISEDKNLPLVVLPDTKIQPRSALGFSVVALAYLINNKKLLSEIESIKGKLNPEELENKGKEFALNVKGLMPIIYSSSQNFSLAYNWKIKFNETGKIPAFYNVFPELNHNEMTGFDLNDNSKNLSEKFVTIFLFDKNDHPQIQKRMTVTKKLYEDRNIKTILVDSQGESTSMKIFNSLILADWIAYYVALSNNAEPEQVPMVEEFKRLVS